MRLFADCQRFSNYGKVPQALCHFDRPALEEAESGK